jgi:hypothetical protein
MYSVTVDQLNKFAAAITFAWSQSLNTTLQYLVSLVLAAIEIVIAACAS